MVPIHRSHIIVLGVGVLYLEVIMSHYERHIRRMDTWRLCAEHVYYVDLVRRDRRVFGMMDHLSSARAAACWREIVRRSNGGLS